MGACVLKVYGCMEVGTGTHWTSVQQVSWNNWINCPVCTSRFSHISYFVWPWCLDPVSHECKVLVHVTDL